MIEDVAVKHPLPRIVGIPHDESRGLVLRYIHAVLPASIAYRHAVAIQQLELKSVQMEWMVHPHEILDLPDLGCSELRGYIHASHVHDAAVQEALSHRYHSRGNRLCRIERRNLPQRPRNCDR